MNIDCKHWEALGQGRKRAKLIGAYPQIDEIDRQLVALANDVLADPRRQAAVRQSSPAKFAEMAKIAQVLPATETTVNLAALEMQLPNMNDEAFNDLLSAVEAERSRRIAINSV